MQYQYKELECLQKTEDVKVTKSKNLKTGRIVCIKRIRVSQLESAHKLLEEIITLYALRDYPYFCNIVEYFIKGKGNQLEKIYIVTEYCAGGNLCKDIIDRNQLGARYSDYELEDYFVQLLAGFAFMEKRNFYHRDIKPDNIFVTENNTLLIGDFGGITTTPENNPTIIGSPSYMSPEMRLRLSLMNTQEQLEDIDIGKSDVWSLGVTFLFMITAHSPKDLQNIDSIEGTLKQKFNSIENSVFKQLLIKMLVVDPSKRLRFCALNEWFLSKTGRKLDKGNEKLYWTVDNSLKPIEESSRNPLVGLEKPLERKGPLQLEAIEGFTICRRPSLLSIESNQDGIGIAPTHLVRRIASQRSNEFNPLPNCESCDLSTDFTYCKHCKHLCHIPCLQDAFFSCPKCKSPLNYSAFKLRCMKCQVLFNGKFVNPNCKHRLCSQCQTKENGCKYCFGLQILGIKPARSQKFPEFEPCGRCGEPFKVQGKNLVCETDKIYICAVCKRTKHDGSCIFNDSRKIVKCFECSDAMIKESGSVFVCCKRCNRIYCYVCMKSVNEASHLNCFRLYCQ